MFYQHQPFHSFQSATYSLKRDLLSDTRSKTIFDLLGGFLVVLGVAMSQEGQNPGHLPPQDPALQQQQQPQSAVQQLQSSAAPTEFQCQWVGCGERAANAEQLYVRLLRQYPW